MSSKSNIWKYFMKLSSNNKVVVCRLCTKKLKRRSIRHLVDHIRQSHYANFKPDSTSLEPGEIDYVEKEQETRKLNISELPMKPSNSLEKIKKSLLYMLVCDGHPLSFVENEGFHKFVKVVEPEFQIPSVEEMRKMLDLTYEDVGTQLRQKLAAVKNVSLSVDLWSNVSDTNQFFSVDIYFFHDSKMENVTINVIEIQNEITTSYLTAQVESSLQKYQIPVTKITAITNPLKIILPIIPETHQTPSVSHQINQIGKKVFSNPDVKVIYQKVSHIFNFLHRHRQDILNFETGTLWNTKYSTLKSYLEYEIVINKLLEILPDAPFPITEVDELTDLYQLLQLLTNAVSGLLTEFVSVSLVIPLVYFLKTKLNRVNVKTSLGFTVKEQIVAEVDEEFKDFQEVLILATALDPRFKLKYLGKAAQELFQKYEGFQDYLNCPDVGLREDPLKWWCENQTLYPSLADMAFKYLSMSASSVDPKSLFTEDGYETKLRQRINFKDNVKKMYTLQTVDKTYWDL